MKDLFPIKISIRRNEYWFAKMQWQLYTIFNIKRTYSCGRRKQETYLCCCQPIDEKHCYLSEDKKTVYCKCCNRERIISSEVLDIKHLSDGMW